MSDLPPAPIDGEAPDGSLAWSAPRRFIDDPDELLKAHGEGELVMDVMPRSLTSRGPPSRRWRATARSLPPSAPIGRPSLPAYVEDLYPRIAYVTARANTARQAVDV